MVLLRSHNRNHVQRHLCLPPPTLPIKQRNLQTPTSHSLPYHDTTDKKLPLQIINAYSQVWQELQQQHMTDTDLSNPLRGTSYVFDSMLLVRPPLLLLLLSNTHHRHTTQHTLAPPHSLKCHSVGIHKT